MIKIPEKHSKKWAFITLALFLLSFAALVAVCLILKIDMNAQNITGFALLSLIVSAVISGAGFLGAKAFFFTTLAFDVIGIVYMLFISITRSAEGWSDLVSIISYMFMLGIGVIAGAVLQLVLFIVSKTKK